jgi:hypothetical protein
MNVRISKIQEAVLKLMKIPSQLPSTTMVAMATNTDVNESEKVSRRKSNKPNL